MDDLGFAPPIGTAGREARTIVRDEQPMAAKVGRNAAGQVAQRAQVTAEDHTINVMQGTEKHAWNIMLYEQMIGPMVATVLGGGLSLIGLKRASVYVKTALTSVSTLRTTHLNEIGKVRGNVVRLAQGHARDLATKKVDGVVVEDTAHKAYGMIAAAGKKAEELDLKDTARLQGFAKAVSPVTKPIGRGFTGLLGWLSKIPGVDKAADWLSGVGHRWSQRGFEKSMGKLKSSFTTEGVGFFGGIRNFFIRLVGKEPVLKTIETPHELKHILHGVSEAHGIKDAAKRAAKLAEVKETVTKLSETKGLSDAVVKHLGRVADALDHTHGLAQTVAGHATAAEAGGLMGLARNIGTRLGRTSLLNAGLALGITAGTAAIIMTTRKENRVATETLKEMKEAIGDDRHPLIVEASKLDKKTHGRRWAAAGLNSAVQGITMGTLGNMSGGAMGGIMAAQMGLMGIGAMIVPENMQLNAFASLRQAEKTNTPLPREQRQFFIKQLVMPGSQDNELADYVAQKLADKNLNARDTLHFIANKEEFIELTVEAREARKKAHEAKVALKTAREAEKEAEAEMGVGKPHHKDTPAATTAPAVHASPETAALTRAITPGADKPMVTIAAAKDTHQGRVLDMQHALGQPA